MRWGRNPVPPVPPVVTPIATKPSEERAAVGREDPGTFAHLDVQPETVTVRRGVGTVMGIAPDGAFVRLPAGTRLRVTGERQMMHGPVWGAVYPARLADRSLWVLENEVQPD